MTPDKSELETSGIAADRIAQIERDLEVWAVKKIEFSFDPAGTHVFSMVELTYSYARRCLDLARAIRSLVAADQVIPATVLGRALIETIAMGCLYVDDMERLIAVGELDRWEKRLFKFHSGVRGHAIGPVHVMDAMRHLETIDGNYVAYLEQKYTVFNRFIKAITPAGEALQSAQDVLSAMKNYDLLSEVSHPNGIGTQFLYPDPSNENEEVARTRARFRSAAIAAIWQCHHLITALGRQPNLADRYWSAFGGSTPT